MPTNTRRVEELAQQMLDQRGYLVVRSNFLFSVGAIMSIQTVDVPADGIEKSEAKGVVVQRTDAADMDEQRRLLGFSPALDRWPYYYRVIAE